MTCKKCAVSDRQYCSSACKQRAYRERVAEREAQQRRAEHEAAEAERVRLWITYLTQSAGLSRKQAERTVAALDRQRVLIRAPWIQGTLTGTR